jgi:DNA adenine methylase
MQSISPLRYPGGKTRAIKKLKKYLPQDVKTICSPFFGGGSYELYCILNFGIKVVAYDLFEPLTVFWKCLLEDPARLAKIVSRFLPVVTKEQFYTLQKTFPQIEEPWEQAGAFFILNRTSFSGSTQSGGFSPLGQDGRNGRFNERNVEFLRNFRVPEGMLNVGHFSFEESILRHTDAFIYADPPYLVDSRLYGHYGGMHEIDHVLLADILRSRDNWMLCYNDCPEVRRLYGGLHVVDGQDGLSWQYGMSKSKKSREVLILSRDVEQRLGLKTPRRMRANNTMSVKKGVWHMFKARAMRNERLA